MSLSSVVSILVAGLIGIFVIVGGLALVFYYFKDKFQKQSSILRNFPVVGHIRYLLEQTGPEFRQYLFDGDKEGKPFSRVDFLNIVMPAKYLKTVISFGSKRDFDKAGYYIRNAMFPVLTDKMKVDNETKLRTKKYHIKEEGLFSRKEKFIEDSTAPYLLPEVEAIVIGEGSARIPFKVRGQIGMSGMSYGALGENAIQALSKGLSIAGGTWMNTGEGGLSKHHLSGGADIIMQIGPAKFGVRTPEGRMDWEEVRKKGEIPNVKAFELKLGQGAKIRGGLLPAEKNTPDIAEARGVKPYTTVSSPNRFDDFEDMPSLMDFVEKIREVTGKPVGIKIVVGGTEEVMEMVKYMKDTNRFPDFISIDGGEGGSGATYQEMADSMGLPIKSALSIVHNVFIHYGIRDKVKLIASGKLFTADKIAIALAMGADLVQIARAYMVTIGCIGAQHCHKNTCPVGVATTDPHLQKALVIEDKKFRVSNYTTTMRQGLYALAGAAGIDCPTKFNEKHVIFNKENNTTLSLKEVNKQIRKEIAELENTID